MFIVSLGLITVTTAGTPVPLHNALIAAGIPVGTKVAKVWFTPDTANTKPAYVGLSTTAPGNPGGATFVGTTGVQGIGVLGAPPTTGKADRLCICGAPGDRATINPFDYAVDVGNNGEKVLVSCVFP